MTNGDITPYCAHDSIRKWAEKRESVLNIQLDEHDKENADLKKERNAFQTQAGARKRECFDLKKKVDELRNKVDHYRNIIEPRYIKYSRDLQSRLNEIKYSSDPNKAMVIVAKYHKLQSHLNEAENRIANQVSEITDLVHKNESVESHLDEAKKLMCKSDSMLSYIRHRGSINWSDKVGFRITKEEVDNLVVKLKDAYETKRMSS